MFRIRRVCGPAALALMLVISANGCGGASTTTVSGLVQDGRTHRPLGQVTVRDGSVSTTTDASGHFTLAKVKASSEVIVNHAHYGELKVKAQAIKADQPLDLTPDAVKISLTDNLMHKPLSFTAEASDTKVTGVGVATVYAVGEGDVVTVTATGYETAQLRLGVGDYKGELFADPKTSYLFQTPLPWSGHADQEFDLFVNPDIKGIASKAEYLAAVQLDLSNGYGLISTTVNSVTILPTWHYGGCRGQGAKDYQGVVLINASLLESTPGGGTQVLNRTEHRVRTAKGIWSSFPLAGCT